MESDKIPVRSVEDFFDNEYRDYAVYVVENRAIPSVIDGFKPSQRKIAYAASRLWKTGNEKPMKVFQLGGQAAAISFFHHGSLDGTIVGMTQEFKNSMPIFQGIGQFGSLRSPVAGAPRYIGVKFNENFRRLYKDFEITTPKYEEGEEIEPLFFLPIIPTVLLNGGSGIAVGFATNILNRHPVDLVDACLCALDGKEVPVLTPWIRGFKGVIEQVEGKEKSWNFRGKFSVKNTTTVEITEIPPSYTYEKYEQHLESLIEKNILASYEDLSSEGIHYVLKFSRATLSNLVEKDGLGHLLKMRESEGENLTTIDENGRLRIFKKAEDIVEYFVKFRLQYYEKRKERLLKELTADISLLKARSLFIESVINGKIVVANEKKASIISSIESLGISKQDNSYDYLLNMPIWSLTQEKYAEFQKKLKQKEAEKKSIEKTSASDFYRQDLLDLRSQVEKTCER